MVVATSMNDYREDFVAQGITPAFRAGSRTQMMGAVNQVNSSGKIPFNECKAFE
jgi:hypothetical protein